MQPTKQQQKILATFPKHPEKIYGDEWKGWKHFLDRDSESLLAMYNSGDESVIPAMVGRLRRAVAKENCRLSKLRSRAANSLGADYVVIDMSFNGCVAYGDLDGLFEQWVMS